jgi:hypothetical protein
MRACHLHRPCGPKNAHTQIITKAENQPTPINILQARVQWISGVAGGGALISVNLGHALALWVSEVFFCVWDLFA